MAVDLSNITGTRLPVGASIKFPDGRSWTRETDNGDPGPQYDYDQDEPF